MIKDEIAMDYKKELKKRISADYEKRVKQWMAADPSQLIDAAEEITAVRLIRDNIEDAINEEDARFLLGLDEPLDEMADRWIAENGLDASHGEELLHCVWTLREELSDDAGTRTVRDFPGHPCWRHLFPDDSMRLCASDRSPGGRTDERPECRGASRRARHHDVALCRRSSWSDGQQRQLRKRRVAPPDRVP